MLNDTIVAISTAIGDGAIGIVRMSGENALNILNDVFFTKNSKKKVFKNKEMSYGFIKKDDLIVKSIF